MGRGQAGFRKGKVKVRDSTLEERRVRKSDLDSRPVQPPICPECAKSVVFRVRKQYINAIINGEKTVEYRKDSAFWLRRLAPKPQPEIAVFICGRRVHRRRIVKIEHILRPDYFSKQGIMDIPTTFCWAIHLGEEIK